MPWIQNVSLDHVRSGFHFDAGPNSMLIQIVDCAMTFPVTKYAFKEVHQFTFMDAERDSKEIIEEAKCQPEQAEALVNLLKHALNNRMNVVVHCVGGLCRSGAVVEVGIIMGFQDTEVHRSPNLLVKHLMMKTLGLTYDENEPYTLNGHPFKYDEHGSRIWLAE